MEIRVEERINGIADPSLGWRPSADTIIVPDSGLPTPIAQVLWSGRIGPPR